MSVLLSPDNPLVVASVNHPDDVATALVPEPGADVIEWRLDGLQCLPASEISRALATCAVPVLLTARREDEGAFAPWENNEGDGARLAALDNFAASARWIDVEARTLSESADWRSAAARWQSMGIGLVVSAHNFATVPTSAELASLADLANTLNAEVLKIAGTTSSLAEVAALGAVFQLPGRPLRSVMGMGKFGAASRLLFATAGSVLNYGYLRAASVPGQWPAAELRRVLREHRG